MINTSFTSPFDAPSAGGLVAVDLDPRREVAHRAIAGYLAGYSGATLDAYRLDPCSAPIGTPAERCASPATLVTRPPTVADACWPQTAPCAGSRTEWRSSADRRYAHGWNPRAVGSVQATWG